MSHTYTLSDIYLHRCAEAIKLKAKQVETFVKILEVVNERSERYRDYKREIGG